MIRHSIILRMFAEEFIHYFSSVEEDWSHPEDARMLAWDFYTKVVKGGGRYASYVNHGLVDVERPVKEGKHYYVCTFPSERAEKAHKYAKAGCDWDEETERPILASALIKISINDNSAKNSW